MNKQFFGKETMWIILGCLCVYIFGALTWQYPVLALPILIAIAIFITYHTYRSLDRGFGLLFTELIIGGHGLLIHADLGLGILTLRHIVFGAFCLGYILRLIQKKEQMKKHPVNFALFMLGTWLCIAFLLGGIQNGWMASFDEWNSYFYLILLVPILHHSWTHTEKRRVLLYVFAGIIYLVSTTIIFAYTYNHLSGKVMHVPYKIFRDARITEVALQVIQQPPAGFLQKIMQPALGAYPYWYRVFNPSHIFLLFGIGMYFVYGLLHGVDKSIRKHWLLLLTFLFLTLFVSMSRSILLALICTSLIIICAIFFLHKKEHKKHVAMTIGFSGIALLCGGILFMLLAMSPIPVRPDLREATFYATSANTTRQSAVISRWTLLTKLHETIVGAPLFGYGFGKTVTYISSDPRIVSDTGGKYETYRFEWGYHDMMIKMGIVGLFLYGYLLWKLFGQAMLRWRSLEWLPLGALLSVLALGIVHVFSPYFNHPLGIGIILLATLCAYSNNTPLHIRQKVVDNLILTFPSTSRVSVVSQDRV